MNRIRFDVDYIPGAILWAKKTLSIIWQIFRTFCPRDTTVLLLLCDFYGQFEHYDHINHKFLRQNTWEISQNMQVFFYKCKFFSWYWIQQGKNPSKITLTWIFFLLCLVATTVHQLLPPTQNFCRKRWTDFRISSKKLFLKATNSENLLRNLYFPVLFQSRE